MKYGDEYEGAFVNFFSGLFTNSNKVQAIRHGVFRDNLPNLNNVVATILVFMVVNFF